MQTLAGTASASEAERRQRSGGSSNTGACAAPDKKAPPEGGTGGGRGGPHPAEPGVGGEAPAETLRTEEGTDERSGRVQRQCPEPEPSYAEHMIKGAARGARWPTRRSQHRCKAPMLKGAAPGWPGASARKCTVLPPVRRRRAAVCGAHVIERK